MTVDGRLEEVIHRNMANRINPAEMTFKTLVSYFLRGDNRVFATDMDTIERPLR